MQIAVQAFEAFSICSGVNSGLLLNGSTCVNSRETRHKYVKKQSGYDVFGIVGAYINILTARSTWAMGRIEKNTVTPSTENNGVWPLSRKIVEAAR